MAELHIGWRAKSSVGFLKPQKPPAKIKAGIKSNNLEYNIINQ